MLPVLTTFLEAHRNDGDTYIFQGAKLGRPLNLSNLARRVIVPTLAKAGIQWHGWQAFRRGLATNLYNLSVPEHDIQAILRHADIEQLDATTSNGCSFLAARRTQFGAWKEPSRVCASGRAWVQTWVQRRSCQLLEIEKPHSNW